MSEMPNDRKGGDNMVTPVRKAASAPEGDRERLRKPWPASKVATKVGTNGISENLKVMMIMRGRSKVDHPLHLTRRTGLQFHLNK